MPETDAGGEDFAEFVAGSLPALLRFGPVLTGSLGRTTCHAFGQA